MQCNFINKSIINTRRTLKPAKIETNVKKWISATNPKTNKTRFVPKFELGELINSGREANVYCVQGFDDKIARVTRGFVYSPNKLHIGKLDSDTFFSSLDEGIKIKRKIQGEPLHGKFWNIFKTPDYTQYVNTLDSLLNLPDKVYFKYIEDVLKIRKNGFDIDSVNPNNFLLDTKNKVINILDISEHKTNPVIKIQDFYHFIDAYRLSSLYEKADNKQQLVLRNKIKRFINKIQKISKKAGYDLNIEKFYVDKQLATCLYY